MPGTTIFDVNAIVRLSDIELPVHDGMESRSYVRSARRVSQTEKSLYSNKFALLSGGSATMTSVVTEDTC